jgi:hypothetical protein
MAAKDGEGPEMKRRMTAAHADSKIPRASLFPFLLVFLVTAFVYAASPVITPCDSAWTTPTALSLLHEGNQDLNEFPDFLAENNPVAIEWIDGRAYAVYPIAISVMALPFVALADFMIPGFFRLVPALEEFVRDRASSFMTLPDGELNVLDIYPAVEFVAAIFYSSLAVAVLFLIAREKLPLNAALLLTGLFAFGTSMWSTSSRALWQHGPAILMMLLALVALTRPERPRDGIAGLLLMTAFLIRPTFVIPLALIGLYLLCNRPRSLPRFTAAAAAPLLLYAVWNLHVYDAPFPPYFTSDRFLFSERTPEAFAGNLISPGRGLFIYSPFLLFALIPMWRAVKSANIRSLDFFLAAVFPAHLLLLSFFYHWWGGYSTGPRHMSDILPALFWFLIAGFAGRKSMVAGCGWLKVAFTLFAAWSLLVHGRASTSYAVFYWNDRPVSIDRSPARLWDWSDPPFLRTGIPPKRDS